MHTHTCRSLLPFHLYPQPPSSHPPSSALYIVSFFTSTLTHNIFTYPRITYLAYGLSIFYHRCQPRVLLIFFSRTMSLLFFPFVNSTFLPLSAISSPGMTRLASTQLPFFLLVYAFYKPTSHVMDAFLVVTYIPSSKKYNHVPSKHNIVSLSACKSSFSFFPSLTVIP